MKKLVGVNERGLRVGEDHQHARLTDAECEMIRQLHEEGMSYNELARKFEVGKSTIADIVKCRRRAQYPVAWRNVQMGD
jgi:IS30 family transposase